MRLLGSSIPPGTIIASQAWSTCTAFSSSSSVESLGMDHFDKNHSTPLRWSPNTKFQSRKEMRSSSSMRASRRGGSHLNQSQPSRLALSRLIGSACWTTTTTMLAESECFHFLVYFLCSDLVGQERLRKSILGLHAQANVHLIHCLHCLLLLS